MIETVKPSRKKPFFPVNNELRAYLKRHGREMTLPICYSDLSRISYSTPLYDKQGRDTHWEVAHYDLQGWDELQEALVSVYAQLKMEGDFSHSKHLAVARIDYCPFGNSNPFRVRIVNKYNDNYDHIYVKKEDASRFYGLELEHLLSPNRMRYLTAPGILVEEHIPGVPGDIFIQRYLKGTETNKIRLAKEIVKFSERCYARLLGDMRSYNFVVDITPDVEDFHYRVRAIDFDQQCYEGRANLYRPQFFKENFPFVELVLKYLNRESIEQYRLEEQKHLAFRISSSRVRVKELLNIMAKDEISTPEKLEELKEQLNATYSTTAFSQCTTMGEVVKAHLTQSLRKDVDEILEGNGQ
ncbi:hypothetical protein V9K67_16975 [Paraflavisolibacter sp. H34]|uniref:hypothetical protein n=1 Tax=Huijunlia imazamoxiresistens TaxID=3127457 RepID=UPI003015FF77